MDKVYDQREDLHEARKRSSSPTRASEPQSAPDEIRFVGDMTKLTLEQDDMLVLQVDAVLSDANFRHITERMSSIFGSGRVVVLDKGMKLGAVRLPAPIDR